MRIFFNKIIMSFSSERFKQEEVKTILKRNKKFWEELIACFPLTWNRLHKKGKKYGDTQT
jgi:hypothetical protein